MNFTPLVKPHFVRRARRTLSWASDGDRLQSEMLRRLLARAASTEVGNRYGFTDILRENDPAKALRNVYRASTTKRCAATCGG